jgi:hypothetical protein
LLLSVSDLTLEKKGEYQTKKIAFLIFNVFSDKTPTYETCNNRPHRTCSSRHTWSRDLVKIKLTGGGPFLFRLISGQATTGSTQND